MITQPTPTTNGLKNIRVWYQGSQSDIMAVFYIDPQTAGVLTDSDFEAVIAAFDANAKAQNPDGTITRNVEFIYDASNTASTIIRL